MFPGSGSSFAPNGPNDDTVWNHYVDLTPFNPKDWMIDRKASAELAKYPFDGNISNLLDWRMMIRNHLLSVNQRYGRIVYYIEKENYPMPFQRLAIEQINAWQRKPWPITAAYWEDGHTYLRLAGAQSSVDSAIADSTSTPAR